MVPEKNTHRNYPEEGYLKIQGQGGSQKPNILKESMKQNCKFQRDVGFRPKKNLYRRGMDIFLNNTINDSPV